MRIVAAVALICLGLSAGTIQGQPRSAAPSQHKAAPHNSGEPDMNWLQDVLGNRELMTEIGQLMEKLQKGIQYPGPRNQSRILPRLPESTVFYAALPNYGETLHQSVQIIQQEMKDSKPLRDFLQKNKLDGMEPAIESHLQKFYEFSQYLGDEVVIAGNWKGQDPSGIAIAEVKKPGLTEFLEKLNNELIPSKSDRLRIFDPQQLAAAGERDAAQGQGPVVLVRQDLVVIGLNVATVREFNSQLDQDSARFTSTALGQRLAQAYQGGAGSLFAIDLHKVINLIPQIKPQDRITLEKTGLADVKYLLASSTLSADGATNWGELGFTGPRHGIASWIAAPGPMGGLDFVSANPSQAGDFLLKSPVQILDDLRDIMGEAAFASLPQMEAQLNINLKQDLLSKLSGEIAYELSAPPANTKSDTAAAAPKIPSFKVILRVSDPAGLQQTLNRLLATAPLERGQREEDGVTFNTLTSPSSSSPGLEINYFFLDGYLVIASDPATARSAVRAHRSGDSLAKSGKLVDSGTRGGQPANASIVSYQDFGRMLGPMLSQLPPEMRNLAPLIGEIATKPDVIRVYADEAAFRTTLSSNVQADAMMVLIGAAIGIPSLMQSRTAATEASAVAVVRTVNTAEITYATVYPAKGFAANLAVLGPGAGGECAGSSITAEHACLLDEVVGNSSCTSGQWCTKSGYKFSVRGVCLQGKCVNYVVTATPANASTGGKSYCSTNDGIIRLHTGAALEAPLTSAECKVWAPIR